MDVLSNPETWIALLTLTTLEIVLGIDNVIFISVLVQRLPTDQRDRARLIGLGLAAGMRILLLLTISWIIGLTATVITIGSFELSWRDIILIVGGLFCSGRQAPRSSNRSRAKGPHATAVGGSASFGGTLAQIVALDIVFSLDSVLTAVGLVDEIPIMIAAILIAVGVMLIASGPLSKFVHEHPSVKMLALAFLLLIGVTLVADGLGFHIDKAYIYFAMAFSVFVEVLNLARRRKRHAVELNPDVRQGQSGGPPSPPASPATPA
jgi:predicted tellurium resistance membrane protein TerC